MIRVFILAAVATLMTLPVNAQESETGPVYDKNNKYLVWTSNVRSTMNETPQTTDTIAKEEKQKEGSFMERYFPYLSMCEWKPGMRFMVLPEKKDMVIRTFADSVTNELMSSLSLRYKIMVYQGHTKEALHDRVWFKEEESGKAYYYELPIHSFDEYCYTKAGVPTLAYLGDVDMAREHLVGKMLETTYHQYNIDVSTTSYGYDKVPVQKGTVVKVIAVGIGSRSFPVKIIVEDKNGHEFYQNVCISRTNSGMRDEEFGESDNVKHTFEGAFRILDDATGDVKEYDQYIGEVVQTLYETDMTNQYKISETIERLTEFVVKDFQPINGTDYITVTLVKDGKPYTKSVTFVHHSKQTDGLGSELQDDYFKSLFHIGKLDISKINPSHLEDIRRGIVRPGFTEEEVEMALGTPDDKGSTARGTTYTWIYKSVTKRTQCTVFFSKKAKRVTSVER
jgi:hypothetical protein